MTPRIVAILCTLLFVAFSGQSAAHEVRPGYLELRQLDVGRYDVLWKLPASGNRHLALSVRLPTNCTSTAPVGRFVDGAYIERWRVDCDGGLAGREIGIDGLAATRTDVLVRVQRSERDSETARLTADTNSFTLSDELSATQAAISYTGLGVEHILLGIDHLLFVLGLLWIARGGWPLLKTVTAFTLAHSLTLAMATFGWIDAPVSLIESLIALSIVFVAVEALKLRREGNSLGARRSWRLAFAFGLLHGLGFAAALGDLGIPQSEIPLALLFFNVGVELGQLLFIAAVLTVAQSARRVWLRGPRWSTELAIYLLGSSAAFWFIERSVQMIQA